MMTNEIVKAALLGTDKYTPAVMPDIQEIQDKIMAQPTSKEDRFLKLAAAILLYEEAGAVPQIIDAVIPECPSETAAVIDARTARLFNTALRNKEDVIFQFIVYRCSSKMQVVTPELVPVILNKALEQKKDYQQLVAICGVMGKWLCSLNENWSALVDEEAEEDVWGNGAHDARKTWLLNLRQSDPSAAVNILAQTIDKESPANRLSFLEVLRINPSTADEPLLQLLLQDKSQKVKDMAMALLRRMNGSAVNNAYLNFLTQAIQVKEERYMLVSKKKVLHISEQPVPDESIFKTGIDKVSTDKNVTDAMYVIARLLSLTDPSALASALGTTDEELFTLFTKYKDVSYLLPYMATAAALHKNRDWALLLLKEKDIDDVGLLHALNDNERPQYYPQFVNAKFTLLLPWLFAPDYKVMSLSLAERVLMRLSKEAYGIKVPQYQRLALHMPREIIGKMMTMKEEPGGGYEERYFKAQLTEMLRIMELKNMVQ